MRVGKIWGRSPFFPASRLSRAAERVTMTWCGWAAFNCLSPICTMLYVVAPPSHWQVLEPDLRGIARGLLSAQRPRPSHAHGRAREPEMNGLRAVLRLQRRLGTLPRQTGTTNGHCRRGSGHSPCARARLYRVHSMF